MKRLLIGVLLFLSFGEAWGAHITGGEMYYEYLGPGSQANTKRYRITLLLFRDQFSTGAGMPAVVTIGIYSKDNGQKFVGTGANNNWDVNLTTNVPIPINPYPPCIQNAPTLSYNVGSYPFTVDLPNNFNGYTCAYQTCCRVNGIANVPNNSGSTFSCEIPGSNQLAGTVSDRGPRFNLALDVICENENFTLNFGATDVDGDSLSYSFCSAYNGGAATNAGFDNPAPPPYTPVSYIGGFSGGAPLGALATINPNTGLISGIAPAAGKYVVAVCVQSWRNGELLTTARKDLIVTVSACTFNGANVDPDFITCDGFTVTFNNYANNPPGTLYHWDFGVPWLTNDTSDQANTTYTYPDTGLYIATLKVILPGGACIDSAKRLVAVYPGFLPGFLNSQPVCVGVPIQFTDTTFNRYGTKTGWRWDFGVLSATDDTSILQNPVYTYTAPGTYPVTLHVENTLGCEKDYTKSVTVVAPAPVSTFPKDTTICALDSLQLTATTTGSGVYTYSWSPNYNIINRNTATPLVYPAVPTKYFVTLNDNGCLSQDSVMVRPLNDLTNSILASATNICEEDTITLTGNSNKTNNLSWSWNPITSLSSPSTRITQAWPSGNVTYNLTTRWGNNCVANASVNIVVTPLAIPNAGPDEAICEGQGSVQLNATGGVTYSWSPPTGLSNPNIANPIASPAATTQYRVAVGVTGCAKTRSDTVDVLVRPRPALAITNDTLICSIDTLQLTGNGVGNFLWSPNYMINSLTAQNPLISPDVPTRYYVQLTDAFGCINNDSVFVDVKLFVTLDAGNDTSVCQTDGFFLNTTSDALSYKWTPGLYLSSDTEKNPFASPTGSIRYKVVANIGKCQAEDSVDIRVVPYPDANAGADTAICIGDNARLFASGGTDYVWSPPTFLDNRFSPNPIVQSPTGSIQYIVTVTDTLGCPKPGKDTVFVRVFPKIIANAGPRDTSVVIGEPLQLQGSGGTNYLWTPGTWLNSRTISNPIAIPQSVAVIDYVLEVRNSAGCLGTDSIRVTVYDLESGFYVPTAFTPNGDGLNDILRPIALGMRELTYFNVFNRFGQLVYSTSVIGQGWDGIFKNKPQDAATYVWYAEGVTAKGQVIRKKGYAVLIR